MKSGDILTGARMAEALADFACEKCGRKFKRTDKAGKVIPGGYRLTCPGCGNEYDIVEVVN